MRNVLEFGHPTVTDFRDWSAMTSPFFYASTLRHTFWDSISLFFCYSITSPSPPRCSDHRRSPCTVCGSATVAIIPLQARFVPLCAFRSINAPSIAFPVLQASSTVSTSCLSRQPHKACCCHSPLRSLTGVANANELPQLILRSAA